MTREQAIKIISYHKILVDKDTSGILNKQLEYQAIDMAIKALEQESRKDEIILTNKEYRELMANEYDHGYCKGYAEALEEKESILDKIYADIQKLRGCSCSCSDGIIDDVEDVLDKYKAEEAETHPINENIAKGFEEFTKMMFRQGQAESELEDGKIF